MSVAPLFLEKVIAALPAVLKPNTVYTVRVGAGFDLYVSDSTGSIAHKVNSSGGAVSFVTVTLGEAQEDWAAAV